MRRCSSGCSADADGNPSCRPAGLIGKVGRTAGGDGERGRKAGAGHESDAEQIEQCAASVVR